MVLSENLHTFSNNTKSLPHSFSWRINNTFTALSILAPPDAQTVLKNNTSVATKRHVVLLKTSRRFHKNNTSFFQKNALVFSRTSASFFRPYKMGSHSNSDVKTRREARNSCYLRKCRAHNHSFIITFAYQWNKSN